MRKACADVFVPVSCVCSNETRQNILTPLFVSLLCDQSKWVSDLPLIPADSLILLQPDACIRGYSKVDVTVRVICSSLLSLISLSCSPSSLQSSPLSLSRPQVKMAAFQSLGPFISTFADPAKTGLYYTDGGLIVLEDGKDQESNSSGSTDSGCSTDSHHSSDEPFCESSSAGKATSSSSLLPSYVHSLSLNETKSPTTTTSTSSSNVMMAQSQVAAAIVTSVPVSYAKHVMPAHSRRRGSQEEDSFFRSTFSAFQFWRIPITDPSFDPEISCVDIGASATVVVRSAVVGTAAAAAVAGDEELLEEGEEGMAIDPPPHPPQEDDCRKRLGAYYNSHGDDQEDGAEQNTKRGGGREEEPNQRQDEDRDEEAGGRGGGQDMGEHGRDGTRESAPRPDLSSGPADEAEMRDDEIEDDASHCISWESSS